MNNSGPVTWIEEHPAPTLSTSWPRITRRSTADISPWVDLVAREVEFSPDAEPQIYHAIETFDYVIVLAVTPDDRIPIVRQYRPAVEGFTLELPAGLIDTNEDAAATASRELLEEAGLPTEAIYHLGTNKIDAGRISNHVHSYFIRTGPQVAGFVPEDGVALRFVTFAELIALIQSGELDAQADLGTLLQAVLHGHLKLPQPT